MSESNKSVLAVVVLVFCCVLGCSWYESYKIDRQKEEKIEAKRQDSIRKVYITDSLAHDPHYQDSVRKAEARYRKWKVLHDSISTDEVVGFLLSPTDSFYHITIHPLVTKEDGMMYNFSVGDIPDIRFVTHEEIIINHYTLCTTCEEFDDIYCKYENGELVENNE